MRKLVLIATLQAINAQFSSFRGLGGADAGRPEDPDVVRMDLPLNRRYKYAFTGGANPKLNIPSGVTGSCNEEIDLTSVQSGSGKLASPGFEAGFYPNNTECSYVIRAGNSSVLELSFLYMDIEPGPPACPFDYLEVLDGESSNIIGGNRFCGRNTPGKIISKSNTFRLRFKSDSSETGVGVAVQYTITEQSYKKIFECDFENGWCGMELTKKASEEEDKLEFSPFDANSLQIINGRSGTLRTGAYFDHTFKTPRGQYLLYESSGTKKGESRSIKTTITSIKTKAKETTFCFAFWTTMKGAAMGAIEVKALYYDKLGNQKSSKPLGEVRGEQTSNCWGQGCKKDDHWTFQKFSGPLWEDHVAIEMTFVSGGPSFSDIAIDDIIMDPDTCPTDATTKCRPPVQPYKKYNYKDIITGNWKCKNPKNDNEYDMKTPGQEFPQGTQCTLKCNNWKEMAEPAKHGKIYCGRRGWHSKSSGEAVLNELPAVPGEMPNGSKKDPDLFNLMPICRISRCALQMMPPNAEFFACNHPETLDYLPLDSLCELRCLPGYRRNGPQFSKCKPGGWMVGKATCVKIGEDDFTEEEKARLIPDTVQKVFFEPKEPQKIIGKPYLGDAVPVPGGAGVFKPTKPAPTSKTTTKLTMKPTTKATTASTVMTTKPSSTTKAPSSPNAVIEVVKEATTPKPAAPAGPLEQLAVNSQPTKATTRPTMAPRTTEAPNFFKPGGDDEETTTDQSTTSTEKPKPNKKAKNDKSGPSSSAFTYLSSVLLILVLF